MTLFVPISSSAPTAHRLVLQLEADLFDAAAEMKDVEVSSTMASRALTYSWISSLPRTISVDLGDDLRDPRGEAPKPPSAPTVVLS
jgi:hypothetical protein